MMHFQQNKLKKTYKFSWLNIIFSQRNQTKIGKFSTIPMALYHILKKWKIQGLTTRNQCFPCHTLSSWQGNFQRHGASYFYLVATGKWMKETTNEDRGRSIGQGRVDGKSKRGSDLPNYVFYFPSRRILVQNLSILALWTLKN